MAAADTDTQVSAFVSAETKEQLERHTRATGVKKAFLIEQALLHHLAALDELPQDVIIPPRLVLSKRSGKQLMERLAKPPKPTAALRRLMKHGR